MNNNKMGYNIYNNTCALCGNTSISVIKVCIQDNFEVLREIPQFEIIFKTCNPYSYLLMCEFCLMKFRIFIKCNEEYNNSTYYYRMQDCPPVKENIEHIEDTSCQCEHCKAKFGNLPLLAEVIEKIEDKSSFKPNVSVETSEQSIEQEHTSETFAIEKDIPQPSTSRERTSRKIMNCEHCGKCFTHKGDLNKHLRKHTGEQPFQCPICQRNFAHTSNLTRHLRVHSGDKPFVCEKCNKSFSRKDKLLLHQKTKLCMSTSHSSS